MTKLFVMDISDAAERVRVARTFAAMRQDEESAKELIEALEAFRKAQDAIKNSVAIKRLVEEVRTGDTATSSYNRTYSRHNRS